MNTSCLQTQKKYSRIQLHILNTSRKSRDILHRLMLDISKASETVLWDRLYQNLTRNLFPYNQNHARRRNITSTCMLSKNTRKHLYHQHWCPARRQSRVQSFSPYAWHKPWTQTGIAEEHSYSRTHLPVENLLPSNVKDPTYSKPSDPHLDIGTTTCWRHEPNHKS